MYKNGPQPSIGKAVVQIVLALILLVSAIVFAKQKKDNYTYRVIEPNCTESGYTLVTHTRTGATEVQDIVPALGHSYGQWEIVREGAGLEPRQMQRVCGRCQEPDSMAEFPQLPIPVLNVSGDFTGIGKKEEVPVMAYFSGEERTFDSYATLKYQGHSSLAYDKKNYTIKFYRDESREEKDKMAFSHWRKENKYILKANYMDPSQCRNLVCADIWANMVAARTSVYPTLAETSNFGAVDGFPVALYLNESFYGLYTMNLHKDDDLLGMKDDQEHAIMIVNHTDGEEAFFRDTAAFEAESPWEVEFCGTENQTWATKKLNDLIAFVQNSSDEEFHSSLKEYLDIESAVDYCIAMYALGLQEHCAKDLILITYGREEPWICTMYDMEEAFDLDGPAPGEADTGSLLWDRFLKLFYPEICARYWQLRSNVLNPDTLCGMVEAFTAGIPDEVYQADASNHGTAPHTPEQTNIITENIRILILRTDEKFAAEGT